MPGTDPHLWLNIEKYYLGDDVNLLFFIYLMAVKKGNSIREENTIVKCAVGVVFDVCNVLGVFSCLKTT